MLTDSSFSLLKSGFCLLILSLFTLHLSAKTIDAPGEYESIQAAIDLAETGDTIQIAAGEYDERISLKEGIRLKGPGAMRCQIRAAAGIRPVISAKNIKAGAITGIHFISTHTKAFSGKSRYLSPVVLIQNSTVDLRACKISQGPGVGLRIKGRSEGTISDCEMAENGAAGVEVIGKACAPLIRNNRICNNHSGGLFLPKNTAAQLDGNQLESNGKAEKDPNLLRPNFITLVSYLWYAQSKENIEYYLKKGGNPNASSEDSINSLIWAVYKDDSALAKLLLNYGAEVNRSTEDGVAPLHYAIRSNRLFIAGIFLDFGANIDAKTKAGYTPFALAVEEKNYLAAKMLLGKGAKVDTFDANGLPPLWYAVATGNLQMVELLLRNGADKKFKWREEKSLKDLAEEQGNAETLLLVLE